MLQNREFRVGVLEKAMAEVAEFDEFAKERLRQIGRVELLTTKEGKINNIYQQVLELRQKVDD